MSSPAITQYEYNSLNQLITKADSNGMERYSYDKRGNLSAITLDDVIKNAYVYGASGRLEQAVNAKGEIVKYLYNGLGNRVGKRLGTLPTEAILPQEPGRPAPIDFHPQRCIDYIIDLTREYNNLLTKSDDGVSCNYAFDTGLLLKGDELFLADELTSPVGKIGRDGSVLAHAAYDEFGIELAGYIDEDFTFIGYQRDAVAGTYFAQAREYVPRAARFAGTDLVAGFTACPFSLNRYTYCYNQPIDYVDRDGKLPTVLIGAGIGAIVGGVGSLATQVISGKDITEIDWKDIGVSALSGAVVGGIAGTGVGAAAISAKGAAIIVGTTTGAGATIGGLHAVSTGGDLASGILRGSVDGAVIGASIVTDPAGAFLGAFSQFTADMVAGGQLSSPETYAGATLGGAVGTKIGQRLGARTGAGIGASVATFVGEELENHFNVNRRTWIEIALDSAASGAIGFYVGKHVYKTASQFSSSLSGYLADYLVAIGVGTGVGMYNVLKKIVRSFNGASHDIKQASECLAY